MAITGQNIADKAEILLVDETNIRWTEPELLGWINSALREIANLKPTAFASNTNMALVSGTKQTLPATAYELIDVVRNLTSGNAAGAAVFQIDRKVLDVIDPNWHTYTASGTVKKWTYDPKDPKTFYVYPPHDGLGGKLEMVVAVIPVAVASLATSLVLDETYEGALVDYVLYRAFSKDIESQISAARAQAYHQTFLQALGTRLQNEGTLAPATTQEG
jgi:hypothetical protein